MSSEANGLDQLKNAAQYFVDVGEKLNAIEVRRCQCETERARAEEELDRARSLLEGAVGPNIQRRIIKVDRATEVVLVEYSETTKKATVSIEKIL